MRALGLVVLLLATSALAQAGVQRGGALKKRQYQTYSALTYFVSPTGNDTNGCTAGGTAACATLNGVYAKLPRIIRNDITINVEAGNYTFSSRWDGAQWSTTDTTGVTAPTVTIAGPALINFTPATSTATGSITSISTTKTPLPTITDSTKSWTTNDLRGRFLTFTSGPAAGTSLVIVSNTATTITHMQWPSATVAATTNTYAIQTPAAVITGDQSIADHVGGLGTLALSNIDFTSASTTGATLSMNRNGNSFSCTASQIRVVKTTGAQNALRIVGGNPCNAPGTTDYYVGQLGTGTSHNLVDLESTFGQGLSSSFRGYFYAAGGAAMLITNAKPFQLAWPRIIAETGSTSTSPVTFTGVSGVGSGLAIHGLYALCPAGSTVPGLAMVGSSLNASTLYARNCSVGFALGSQLTSGFTQYAPSQFLGAVGGTSPILYCDSTTTCLSVARGGRARVQIGTTYVGVTNEYNVDGTVYTNSFINGLSPKRVIGNGGSIVELE